MTIALCTSFIHLNKSYKIRTIVIDAGHGGHDTGCLGSSVKEKNIALSIALKIGKYIEDNFQDVKVIYTRKTDVFLTLYERADIANRNHADLFICVHCNSGNKAAFGIETYVMGLHKTEENLNVSMRENSSILLEKDYKQKYDGYDPNSAESFIIFNLYQNAYMEKSLTFASKVQYQIDVFGNRNNRGVKQAGFLVLYKTAMPSVLIETGFLTNDNEEKYLSTDKGQTNVATSVFRAFKEYKVDMEEGDGGSEANKNIKVKEKEITNAEVKSEAVVKNSVTTKNDSTPAVNKEEPSPIKKDSIKTAIKTETQKLLYTTPLKKDSAISKSIETTKPEEKKEAAKPLPVVVPPKAENKKTVAETPVKKDSIAKPVETPKQKVVVEMAPEKTVDNNKGISNDLFYTIQIGASPNPSESEIKKFKTIEGMTIITADDGMKRFTAGNYPTLEKANSRLSQLKQQGYKDAFVTPYYNGKRITVAEAKKIKQ